MPSGVLSVLMMMMDGVTKNLTEGELACFCYCIVCVILFFPTRCLWSLCEKVPGYTRYPGTRQTNRPIRPEGLTVPSISLRAHPGDILVAQPGRSTSPIPLA